MERAFIQTSVALNIPKTKDAIHVYYRSRNDVSFNYFGKAKNGLLLNSDVNMRTLSEEVPTVFFCGRNRHKRDALFHFSNRKNFEYLDMCKEFYTKEEIIDCDPIWGWVIRDEEYYL